MTGVADPAITIVDVTGEENPRVMAELEHPPRDTAGARLAELRERFDVVDAARRQRAPTRQGDT